MHSSYRYIFEGFWEDTVCFSKMAVQKEVILKRIKVK